MVSISKKANNLPYSPIRKLASYAEAAKKRGIKVYYLNIGQPDIAAPQVAIDAVKEHISTRVEYTFSEGTHSYCKTLVKYYNSINIPVEKSDIIVTTGGSEALIFTINAIADDGDEILIPEPFYANYNTFAVQCGAEVVPITSTLESNYALPEIETFETKITDKTKAIMICNPSNPTGYLYSREELEKLRDLAVKHNIYIICDEVYRDFCYEGGEHVSILEIEGMEQHGIIIDSVSKKFSMCGVRIGAVVSKNKMFMDAVMRQAQARLSPPLFGQIASEAAFGVGQEYFSAVNAEYMKRRNFLVEALNKIEGVSCPMPKGAFYAMVKLPVDDVDIFSQWLLEHFEYEGATVMIAPASGFYATKGLGKQEARIAYVLDVKDLEKSVIILEKAIEKYNNQ